MHLQKIKTTSICGILDFVLSHFHHIIHVHCLFNKSINKEFKYFINILFNSFHLTGTIIQLEKYDSIK